MRYFSGVEGRILLRLAVESRRGFKGGGVGVGGGYGVLS